MLPRLLQLAAARRVRWPRAEGHGPHTNQLDFGGDPDRSIIWIHEFPRWFFICCCDSCRQPRIKRDWIHRICSLVYVVGFELLLLCDVQSK